MRCGQRQRAGPIRLLCAIHLAGILRCAVVWDWRLLCKPLACRILQLSLIYKNMIYVLMTIIHIIDFFSNSAQIARILPAILWKRFVFPVIYV